MNKLLVIVFLLFSLCASAQQVRNTGIYRVADDAYEYKGYTIFKPKIDIWIIESKLELSNELFQIIDRQTPLQLEFVVNDWGVYQGIKINEKTVSTALVKLIIHTIEKYHRGEILEDSLTACCDKKIK